MTTLARIFLVATLMVSAVSARAQLVIEITQGMDDPTAIAVVPFATEGVGISPADIAEIVADDLQRSGQFSPVRRDNMLSYPSTSGEIYFRDWRAIDTEYVLIGRVTPGERLRVDYELFDVNRERSVLSGSQVDVPG